MKLLLILTYSGLISCASISHDEYWNQRTDLLEEDLERMLGSDLVLTEEEKQLNERLMTLKEAEISAGFNGSIYPPDSSFISMKTYIDSSPTFQLLREMPKGAVLHSHDMALVSLDWLVLNLTYWDDLYLCYLENDRILFKFFSSPDTSCDWKLVSSERASYADPDSFDLLLRRQLSILTDEPQEYDINTVWARFGNAFESREGLTMLTDAWKAYLIQTLTEFMEDNVSYLEFRGVLPLLYEKDGSVHTEMETIDIYAETIDNFVAENSDKFFGVRFIYAPFRGVNEETVWDYVDLAEKLIERQPDLVAGFDLVGQEDPGKPLKYFVDPILDLQNRNVSIPVFFHAGETDWQGTDTDENLIDALLFNSTRIGHGYAISKHPRLMELAKEKDIPMEVCPISNQVLKLVEDLRNHPMASLMADQFPVVVSSDDPSMWDALPLSHDFYEAFFAMGGAKADLRFLKKLALNSIRYSSLSGNKLEALKALWEVQWDRFIESQLMLVRYKSLLHGHRMDSNENIF